MKCVCSLSPQYFLVTTVLHTKMRTSKSCAIVNYFVYSFRKTKVQILKSYQKLENFCKNITNHFSSTIFAEKGSLCSCSLSHLQHCKLLCRSGSIRSSCCWFTKMILTLAVMAQEEEILLEFQERKLMYSC